MNPPSTSIWQRVIFPKFGVIIFLRWLFSARILRRLSFFLACFATLTAIFYAEEDWRGRRDWENFKREREAKGENFDWQAFIPPPVPDDQNFALSPFFAEAQMVWQHQSGTNQPYDTNLIEHLRLSLNLPLPPNLKSDLPAISDWEGARDTGLPAWQKYYRRPMPAGSAVNRNGWDGKIFPVTAQPQSPAADVLLALSKYDDVLQLLRSDAQKPLSRFPLGYDGPTYSILLPHLARLKQTAIFLQLQTAALLESGQTDAADTNVNLILYLADSIKSEPFLISYLVRAAILQIGLDAIWEGMNAHRWTPEQLAGFQQTLADEHLLASYINSVEAEICGHCLFMDQLASDPKLAGEIGLLTDAENTSDSFVSKSFKTFRRQAFLRLAPKGWLDEIKIEITKTGFDYVLDAVHLDTGRVDLRISDAPEAHARLLTARSRLWLSELIMADYARSVRRAAHNQSALNLGATACALERCWLANKKYPAKLADLVPEFIKNVPIEVTGGEPLKYRRDSDSQFVLYSTGLTGEDFGGKRYNNDGKANGNWVWSNEAR